MGTALPLPPAGDRSSSRAGFTLVELLVVISIIILAAGLMTPTITDFFRNRQLEGIRGYFGSSFNTARLEAVQKGFPFSVVFFRDGSRVFNEKLKVFLEGSGPSKSPFTEGVMWYELGFLGRKPSTELPLFREWEERARAGAGAASARATSDTFQFRTDDLPKVTFERDGSLRFTMGADVDSRLYKDQKDADIVIYQAMSHVACFIDLRLPGQFKSQIIVVEELPKKPDAPAAGGAEAQGGGGA
jgi:prepilin-type N-terminal cleavage/methylation domain-containing protein